MKKDSSSRLKDFECDILNERLSTFRKHYGSFEMYGIVDQMTGQGISVFNTTAGRAYNFAVFTVLFTCVFSLYIYSLQILPSRVLNQGSQN